jgi:hypothetical protein
VLQALQKGVIDDGIGAKIEETAARVASSLKAKTKA